MNGFWSLTRCTTRSTLFSSNTLNRYSLGTKNKDLKRNADGSLTIHIGPTSPGKDQESNWLPSPGADLALYIRSYWGKDPILDGSWQRRR